MDGSPELLSVVEVLPIGIDPRQVAQLHTISQMCSCRPVFFVVATYSPSGRILLLDMFACKLDHTWYVKCSGSVQVQLILDKNCFTEDAMSPTLWRLLPSYIGEFTTHLDVTLLTWSRESGGKWQRRFSGHKHLAKAFWWVGST